MKNELLPLGTVFKLVDSPTKIMIIGYFPIGGKTKKMYQYLGVNYPFGIGGKKSTILFDEDAIGSIEYIGFLDDSIEKYNAAIKKLVEETVDTNNIMGDS